MSNLKINLEKLVKSNAISGYEWKGNIVETIENIIGTKGQNISNNLVYISGNGKKTIFISAHMDEIGFFITNISKNFASILPIGGINSNNLKNEVLCFNNNKFKINGNFKSFTEIKLKNANNLSIGDVGTFEKNIVWKNDIITSPSLDNKVGCLALIELIKQIKKLKLDKKIIFCFSSREETGANGVISAIRKFNPDLCIDIDSAYAKPINNIKEKLNWTIPNIGKGSAIQLMGDGFVINSQIREFIESIIKKNKIPFQYEIPDSKSGGTNASNILSNGYEVLQINIPVANQHSAKSKASIKDIETTIDLLFKLLIEI